MHATCHLPEDVTEVAHHAVLQAGDAVVTEIARMNAGQRSAKSASAYLKHLIGQPHLPCVPSVSDAIQMLCSFGGTAAMATSCMGGLTVGAPLAGTPQNSQYNTPNDTPSGSQASGSPFRPPPHLQQSTTAGRDLSGAEGYPQVCTPLP